MMFDTHQMSGHNCKRAISLQGFDDKGKSISVSQDTLMAPLEALRSDVRKLALQVRDNSTITIKEGKNMESLDPGTYIVNDMGDDNVIVGLGPGFSCGGSLQMGMNLDGRFLSINNNTGKSIFYTVTCVFPDSVSSLTNSIPNGYEILSFPNAELDSATIDFHVANDCASNTLVMTGIIIVTTSGIDGDTFNGTTMSITDEPYVTVDISEGNVNYFINNKAVTTDTYVGIAGVPSEMVAFHVTVYTPVGKLFLTNATGIPMTYSVVRDGVNPHSGISYGGIIPPYLLGGTIYIEGSIGPLFNEDTGVLIGLLANLSVSTSILAPKVPVDPHVGAVLTYSTGTFPISVANNGTFVNYFNSVDPNIVFTSTLAVDTGSVMLGAYVTSGTAPILFTNNTGVPLLLYPYGAGPSDYEVIQDGDSYSMPEFNGTVGMTIIPGTTGVEAFYILDTSTAPTSYVGSNDDDSFILGTGTLLNPSINIIINPTDRYPTYIPVSMGVQANIIYVSDDNIVIYKNFTTGPVVVEYQANRVTLAPGETVVGDNSLVSIISLITQTGVDGPYVLISDQGIRSISLTDTVDPGYTTNFVDGVYRPDIYDLVLPTTIGNYSDDITIVIPPLTNTKPIISNIYSTVALDITMLNESGHALKIHNTDSDGSETDTDVAIGEEFDVPRASRFTLYIPVPTGSPVVINTSTGI